jgi:hypothetical protein
MKYDHRRKEMYIENMMTSIGLIKKKIILTKLSNKSKSRLNRDCGCCAQAAKSSVSVLECENKILNKLNKLKSFNRKMALI